MFRIRARRRTAAPRLLSPGVGRLQLVSRSPVGLIDDADAKGAARYSREPSPARGLREEMAESRLVTQALAAAVAESPPAEVEQGQRHDQRGEAEAAANDSMFTWGNATLGLMLSPPQPRQMPEPAPLEAPCATSQRVMPLHAGACCPSPGRVELHIGCVTACLRRAQQLAMGSVWSAPRLVGSKLLPGADNVTRDGAMDMEELVLLATRVASCHPT